MRLWGFDASRQNDPPLYGWTLDGPRPITPRLDTVTEMDTGPFYIMLVDEAQTVTLNGRVRQLFAVWNLLEWQGRLGDSCRGPERQYCRFTGHPISEVWLARWGASPELLTKC